MSDLFRGAGAGAGTKGVFWWGRLVCAFDGTSVCCPDTPANLRVFGKGGSNHGGTGYPMIRLLALVACGTRTIIDATFGSTHTGETSYPPALVGALHGGMIVLGDRNFAAQALITAITGTGTGADLLIRTKSGRRLPLCRRLPDDHLSRIGPVEVRVVRAEITIATSAGRRSEVYQLVTTVLDTDQGVAGILVCALVLIIGGRNRSATAYECPVGTADDDDMQTLFRDLGIRAAA